MIPERTSSVARLACLSALIALSPGGAQAGEPAASAPRPIPTPEQYAAASERFSNRLEEALEEPYVGITASGGRQTGLYRIHSPVILIEFDHETPVGLRQHYLEHTHN